MFTQVLRFYEIRYLAFIPKGQLVDTFDLASQPSICSVNQATLLSEESRRPRGIHIRALNSNGARGI